MTERSAALESETQRLAPVDDVGFAISRQNAANRLAISTRTLDDWANRGLIRKVRIGGRTLIPTSELQRILDGR